MKKKLLFIMNNLVCGGAEKALISLLESLDYKKYDVDLFLFRHHGPFMNHIPDTVNLLPEPRHMQYFDMPIARALIASLIRGKLLIAFYRIMLGWLAKTNTSGATIEQKFWKYLSRTLKPLRGEYDAAIGFLERSPIYYCVDRVKAKQKWGWIHTDYRKLTYDIEIERGYFERLTYIATVSDGLVRILEQLFPEIKGKFVEINNIISTSTVRRLSTAPLQLPNLNMRRSLISVGRLAKEKGLDITLEALKILTRKGYDLKWYIVGEGDRKAELEKLANNYHLVDHIEFLGHQDNPYPFIKQADIYIQTSKYEGKSLSIQEAKILAKPIVITNFGTATEHIEQGINGLICEMTPESVADGIEQLLRGENSMKDFSINLLKEHFGTEKEIDRFYGYLESVI